jgi:hypothetical protein
VREVLVRASGLLFAAAYAAFIVSVYARQPRPVRQLAGGVAASVGAYRVDPVNFQEGLRFFRATSSPRPGPPSSAPTPAREDAAPRQFYIAYSYYPPGLGPRVQGRCALSPGAWRWSTARSRALPADGSWWSDPPCACTLRTSCARSCSAGWLRELSDLNPMKVLEERKVTRPLPAAREASCCPRSS